MITLSLLGPREVWVAAEAYGHSIVVWMKDANETTKAAKSAAEAAYTDAARKSITRQKYFPLQSVATRLNLGLVLHS
jgi:hypothetical protein